MTTSRERVDVPGEFLFPYRRWNCRKTYEIRIAVPASRIWHRTA